MELTKQMPAASKKAAQRKPSAASGVRGPLPSAKTAAKPPAKKRVRREQQRSLDTKQAIIDAALRAFADKGFEGASTREIAELADVNHRLIAHHFGGKDSLWQATAKYVFGTYAQRLRKRYRGLSGVDEPVLLRLMLREFIIFSAKVPQLHRFMVQANEGDRTRLEWLVANYLAPGIALELKMLRRAQNSGLLRTGDVMHLRYLFIGAATSVFTLAVEYQQISGENPFEDKFVDRHVDMVLSLFLTRST
jgi:TetR/AcrR family transcriptional regulator